VEGEGCAHKAIPRYDGKDLREANELRWEMFLEKGLSALDKDAKAIAADLKSADWKVTLAALLKKKTSATNVWISQKLKMGAPDAVSRYVSEFRRNEGDQNESYKEPATKVMP
jgi:hypothetical protein